MDHRTKLKWARKRFEVLDEDVGRFMQSDPYDLRVKFDAEEGGYTATLRNVKEPPSDWSLMIGDIVHNIRSALDAIIYSLAHKQLGRTPTDEELKQVQFPIVDDIKDWNGECGRRLAHVDKPTRAEVFWVQPCLRTDFTQRHPLSVLRDLSNIDKHRHIVLLVAVAASSSIELSGPFLDEGTSVAGYAGPLKEGTVIARWNFAVGTTVVPPIFHGEMNAYGKLGLDVEFAKSGATPSGGSVMGFLPALFDFVERGVFPPLEQILCRP